MAPAPPNRAPHIKNPTLHEAANNRGKQKVIGAILNKLLRSPPRAFRRTERYARLALAGDGL